MPHRAASCTTTHQACSPICTLNPEPNPLRTSSGKDVHLLQRGRQQLDDISVVRAEPARVPPGGIRGAASPARSFSRRTRVRAFVRNIHDGGVAAPHIAHHPETDGNGHPSSGAHEIVRATLRAAQHQSVPVPSYPELLVALQVFPAHDLNRERGRERGRERERETPPLSAETERARERDTERESVGE